MSLDRCVKEALEAGKITQKQADQITDDLDGMTPEQQIESLVQKNADKALAKRQKMLQGVALSEAIKNAESHPDVFQGVMALMTRDIKEKAKYSNVESIQRMYYGRYQSKMNEVMSNLRQKFGGLTQDKDLARRTVKEVFGDDTGDPLAKSLAKQWSETAEMARLDFNKAGGAIKKRSDWGLPQYHDEIAVVKAGRQTWKDDVRELLDLDKMEVKKSELDEFLDAVYDTVESGGVNKLKLQGNRFGGKLANRHQQARVLSFKDADSWLKYSEKYGRQDIYTTMMSHLEGTAQEIGLMKVLGPNPSDAIKTLEVLAQKNGVGAIKRNKIKAVYTELSGTSDMATSIKFAESMSAVRNIVSTATLLGSASVSAISDTAFNAITARMNGLSAMRVMRNYLKNIGKDGQQAAIQLGIVSDSWLNTAAGSNRLNQISGHGITRKMADATIRWSGLSWMTQAGKNAFGMELSGFIAKHIDRPFSKLPNEFKKAIEKYGIDSSDWASLKKADIIEKDGARFFDFSSATDEAGEKINRMLYTEMEFAVPEPNARTTATLNQGLKPGTIAGELLKSVTMLKSFPVTMVTGHLARGFAQDGMMSKFGYLAKLMIATSVMGVFAYQAKQLIVGKEPISMDLTTEEGRKLMMAGALQGGGLGIFGDFLFSDVNRFGQGLSQTMVGPMAGVVDDVAKLTVGNVQEAFKGDDTNILQDLVDTADRYTPVVGTLWYTRLLYERAIIDQLDLMTDPKARKKFRRKMKRARKEYKQDYWWKPGETKPRG